MEFLYMFFAILIYFTLLCYPFFGIYQIADAIYRYTRQGKSFEYYTDLEKYGSMVIFYGIAAALLFTPPVDNLIENHFPIFYLIFLFIIPIPIALFKWKISKKEYFEEIEKLIF